MMEMTCFFSQSGPTTSSHSTTHEERRCSHCFPAAFGLVWTFFFRIRFLFFVEDPVGSRVREDLSLISMGSQEVRGILGKLRAPKVGVKFLNWDFVENTRVPT